MKNSHGPSIVLNSVVCGIQEQLGCSDTCVLLPVCGHRVTIYP